MEAGSADQEIEMPAGGGTTSFFFWVLFGHELYDLYVNRYLENILFNIL